MFFINGSRTEIINAAYVERFCIVKTEDSALVVASYGQDVKPVTLARYSTEDEAIRALSDLSEALSSGDAQYCMNVSTGRYLPQPGPKERYHGKKVKRHGGS